MRYLWCEQIYPQKLNVFVLLYHLVCPAKYRRVVFTGEFDAHPGPLAEPVSATK